MEIVVQKYGGSSVADISKLERVAKRIAQTARKGKRVCIVVSAMGGSTDELMALAKQITASPPRRELDMLLSSGERIAMALLAMAIQKHGFQAISFTGSQSGIITNDCHSGAQIIEIRPIRIQDELSKGKIVIVAGFQGMSYKREITTLGRGGSDTTAVALASALKASYCVICSDVDGIYTADPQVVPEAFRLAKISYCEMLELSEHGAQILNSESVKWAQRTNLLILTSASHKKSGHSKIGKEGTGMTTCGIALSRDIVSLQIQGSESKLQSYLNESGLKFRRMVGEKPSEGFWIVSINNQPDWSQSQKLLFKKFGNNLKLEEKFVALSIVGVNLPPDTIKTAIQKAKQSNIKVIGFEISQIRVTLLIHAHDARDLTRSLHKTFIHSLTD